MTVRKERKFKDKIVEKVRKYIEQPLYTCGILAYSAGVKAASLRNRKALQMCQGHKLIGSSLKESIAENDKVIWIHAASLGEFEQGRPLIEKIKRVRPEYKIVLTFFSPSGYEVRKNFAEADCVIYLPFDTPRNVRRFLNSVHPEMAIFVKYEFWRNYLNELHQRDIPTYLISGIFRPDQFFFKKGGSWYAHWLKWFRKIYVQDFGSKSLLESIGVTSVEVAGDTRFDRVADIRTNRRATPVLSVFAGEPGNRDEFVMVVGSSWEEDEKVYAPWLQKRKDVKAVIAPHEFDQQRLENLKKMIPGEVVLYSEAVKDPTLLSGKRILVIDCFGLLSSIYYYGDIAYVGGGFGAGLHNINEAAVYGIPVVYGPNNLKFIEARDMKTLGGGIEVRDADSFSYNADKLLFDPEERRKRGRWAEEYIGEKIGATERIFKDIFNQ